MKTLYNWLLVGALMLPTAALAAPETGTLELGDFENASDFYEGSHDERAPVNMSYAYSGSQVIYTPEELQEIADKNGEITAITYRFTEVNGCMYANFTIKLHLDLIDATQFEADAADNKYHFVEFSNDVKGSYTAEEYGEYAMDENHQFTIELTEPFKIESGKSLLVTAFQEFSNDYFEEQDCLVSYYYDADNVRVLCYADDSDDVEDNLVAGNVATNQMKSVPVVKFDYRYEDAPAVIEVCEAPVFSPSNNASLGPDSEITITTATEGARILYSMDGTEPSLEYAAPLKITKDCTVKAKAVKEGFEDSPVVEAKYWAIIAKAPEFLTPDGTEIGPGEAVLIQVPDNSTVYYGFSAETIENVYDAATGIVIDRDVTVYAQARKAGEFDSRVVVASFTYTTEDSYKIGDYSSTTETFDGSNFYNAPIIFVYNNSASQALYTSAEMAGMEGRSITDISYRYINNEAYEYYESDVKVYLQEVDGDEFVRDESTNARLWFTLPESPVYEGSLEIDFIENMYMDDEITFTLAEPFPCTGKALVVTVVNEAPQYIENSSYVCFYSYDTDTERTAVFCSDSKTFGEAMAENNVVDLNGSNETFSGKYQPVVKFGFVPTEQREEPEPDNPLGVITPETFDNDSEAVYYDLTGMRLNGTPRPGTIVIRVDSNSAQKYIVR